MAYQRPKSVVQKRAEAAIVALRSFFQKKDGRTRVARQTVLEVCERLQCPNGVLTSVFIRLKYLGIEVFPQAVRAKYRRRDIARACEAARRNSAAARKTEPATPQSLLSIPQFLENPVLLAQVESYIRSRADRIIGELAYPLRTLKAMPALLTLCDGAPSSTLVKEFLRALAVKGVLVFDEDSWRVQVLPEKTMEEETRK